jgi:hypothetical protein
MIHKKLLLSALFSTLILLAYSQVGRSNKIASTIITKKDFTLNKSIVTVVIGGRRGGAADYSYSFELKSNRKQNIAFDSLWVSGYRVKLSSPQSITADSTLTLEKGDTISLKASNTIKYKSPYSNSKLYEADSFKSPVTYSGKALIRYYKGTKECYYNIASITTKRINLP